MLLLDMLPTDPAMNELVFLIRIKDNRRTTYKHKTEKTECNH